jgi:hypothetical protein
MGMVKTIAPDKTIIGAHAKKLATENQKAPDAAAKYVAANHVLSPKKYDDLTDMFVCKFKVNAQVRLPV